MLSTSLPKTTIPTWDPTTMESLFLPARNTLLTVLMSPNCSSVKFPLGAADPIKVCVGGTLLSWAYRIRLAGPAAPTSFVHWNSCSMLSTTITNLGDLIVSPRAIRENEMIDEMKAPRQHLQELSNFKTIQTTAVSDRWSPTFLAVISPTTGPPSGQTMCLRISKWLLSTAQLYIKDRQRFKTMFSRKS